MWKISENYISFPNQILIYNKYLLLFNIYLFIFLCLFFLLLLAWASDERY